MSSAWGKMVGGTPPGFPTSGPYNLPRYPGMDKEDKSVDSSGNQDDGGSYKAMSHEDEMNVSDLESELISEAEEDPQLPPGHAASSRDTPRPPSAADAASGSGAEKAEGEGEGKKSPVVNGEVKTEGEVVENGLDVGAKKTSEERATPVSPTEIKTQPPRSLLAHHGISTKSAQPPPPDTPSSKSGGSSGGSGRMDGRFPHLPLDFTHPAYLERQFSHPATSASPPMYSGEPLGTPSSGHHWTFEEQFKQLYEMSEDTKRKEFLDDLFSFMQKRGTPVNRIPIMAKQPLDLYELFRLVVSKGGLVEVINKKLWREICKGLNLPSSITSAAFTLRTQYMKYLYPYECEKLKLSCPTDLQSAIDGNRREGRRPGGFPPFDYPIPSMISPPPHLPPGLPMGARSMLDFGALPDDDGLPSGPPPHLRGLVERERENQIRAMQMAHQQAMEQAKKRMDEVVRAASQPQGLSSLGKPTISSHGGHTNGPICSPHPAPSKSEPDGGPPAKRPALDSDMRDRIDRFFGPQIPMPSTHLKIQSRNDGRSEMDSSMMVSMEINGIAYQGVLFAQHPRRL